MSSIDESPAQRSARLRRERREQKIREGASARLDKITSMGGRTHATVPAPETSPFSQVQSTSAISVSEPVPRSTHSFDTRPLESSQVQQEYARALFHQPGAEPTSTRQQEYLGDDPMAKLLSSVLGGITSGDTDAADDRDAPVPSLPDIATSLGVPPFIADMLRGSGPLTEAEKREARTWKVLHVAFSIAVAVYLLFLIEVSISTYGSPPPPPATAQNPFVIFVTGELVLGGWGVLTRGRSGKLGAFLQVMRDMIRDGSIVLFLLGMGTWWHRGWYT